MIIANWMWLLGWMQVWGGPTAGALIMALMLFGLWIEE